jgi:exodeoxyribonuclease V alpha subunit
MAENTEKLIGIVEDITFRNDDNGFTVMLISSKGEDEPITAVGEFPPIAEGQEVVLTGEWGFHQTFGRQFKASAIELSMPTDAAGMLRYLSSGIIRGVRKATAVKIVEAFGADAFEVIENDVNRLASINGISKNKAREIQQSFREQFASREVYI